MVNKTKIENRLRQKMNPYLVDTIIKLKKTNPEIAKYLAMPRKIRQPVNLDKINNLCSAGDAVIVPGKVLSSGELDKKIKIIAWEFSEKALEKIKNKGEAVLLTDEIKKNPELKNLKLII